MASVEIITIGTEILLGHLIDTNAVHIARELADAGVDVYAKHSVGDNTERLAAMLSDTLARADGAITTGGLGPTVDDLTKDAVARAAGVGLELHESSLRAIEERFKYFGRTMSDNNRRQAMLPVGSYVLENPHGTAPGFVIVRADGKFIACMPGVPREMKPMLAERLIPWMKERYQLRSAIYTKTIRTVGWGESEVDKRIEDLFRSQENPKIAVLAHEGRVDIKVMAKAASRAEADAMIAPLAVELRGRLGNGIFGEDEQTLPGAIIAECTKRGVRLATAESCTGGAIADALVSVPGASAAFVGGVVAYSNAVKTSLVGVDAALIARVGAVSEEVAVAMAAGARDRLGAQFAVSTTGIAGPDGGSDEKPVGLVWFGLANPDGSVDSRSMTFPGNRDDIRRRATTAALSLLWRRLERDILTTGSVHSS